MPFDQLVMKKNGRCHFLLIICLMVLITISAYAADTPSSSGSSASPLVSKPNWLTDLSLTVRESYDDNILGVSGKNMPRSFSWVTTLTPKIGIDLAPLFTDKNVLQALSFAYEPGFSMFTDASAENNNAHRIVGKLKAKSDNFSFNIDNTFTYIDGSSIAPIYSGPDSGRSSYAHALPRERRNQYQDRAKLDFQMDFDPFFIRPAGFFQYWDMLTVQRNVSGYQNWVDRYEANGGLDVGRKISSQIALLLGYRYGRQYQDFVINSKYSSTNDYHRTFIGLEGKFFGWLTLSVYGGPDFRSYDDTAPVNDHSQVNFYGETALTAQLSKQDAVTFRYKGNRWMSSTGQVPTFDTNLDLGYRHKFDMPLIWNLGCQIKNADYTVGNLTTGSGTSLRNDWLYAFSTGLSYEFNSHIGVNVNVLANLGRNEQSGVSNFAYREFDECVTFVEIFSRF